MTDCVCLEVCDRQQHRTSAALHLVETLRSAFLCILVGTHAALRVPSKDTRGCLTKRAQEIVLHLKAKAHQLAPEDWPCHKKCTASHVHPARPRSRAVPGSGAACSPPRPSGPLDHWRASGCLSSSHARTWRISPPFSAIPLQILCDLRRCARPAHLHARNHESGHRSRTCHRFGC